MSIESFFGFIAIATSTIGLFPQVYKALKTRSTEDISMLMLINFLICSIAWIIYGSFTNSFCVLFSNILGLLGCVILIFLKKYYRNFSKI